MSLPARISLLVVAFLGVVAIGAFVVIHYFLYNPPLVDYSSGVTANAGATVHVVMQEAPENTVSTHPDWVSYFIQNPQTKAWEHTTLFQVPAGSRIDMTIYGFDGCTPLRNNYWGKVTGVLGNVVDVNGRPYSFINSWSGCNVGHTFSIPSINLNVPMATPGLLQSNKPGLCPTAPCQPGNPSQVPYRVMQFSFMTPHATGEYFWQCRVPCGGGFVTGFGGPMSTIGFMTGSMTVVS